MTQHNSTRAVVEAGLLTAIAVILVFVTIYIPIFYFIGVFLWPIPITLVYIRHGFKYSLLSLIVTGLITAMTYDPISALASTLTIGLMGVVLGYCIKSKKSASVTIMIMSATMFFSFAVVYMIYIKIIGQDVISLALTQIEKQMEIMQKMYVDRGATKEQIDMMKSVYNVDVVKMLIPSSLILCSVIMAFLSYVISGKLLKRFGYNLEKIKPFSEWYMPAQVAIGIVTIVLLGFILYQTDKSDGISYYANAQVIFQYAFMITGLSAVTYLLKKRGMSKFLTAVIIFFIITTPILSRFLMILGIVDYTLDWRRLDPKRKKKMKDI
jgi:uncharacterized protein YybS (DUF2232 family)